jgi:hypothetical protein
MFMLDLHQGGELIPRLGSARKHAFGELWWQVDRTSKSWRTD